MVVWPEITPIGQKPFKSRSLKIRMVIFSVISKDVHTR